MACFMNLEKGKRRRKDYLNPSDKILSITTLDAHKELYKRYRFTRDGVDYLCELLNDDLKMDPRGTPVPVEHQVLISKKSSSII